MRDTKGESGQDYQLGYARVLISSGAACKLGSLSPMKIQTAVYFNFMHMEGCTSLSRVAGDLEMAVYTRGGRVKTLKNAPFVPELLDGWTIEVWSPIH